MVLHTTVTSATASLSWPVPALSTCSSGVVEAVSFCWATFQSVTPSAEHRRGDGLCVADREHRQEVTVQDSGHVGKGGKEE